MKKIRVLIMFVLMAGLANAQNKHQINVKVNGLSNQEIILGYFFGDKKFALDTTKLDNNGFGKFEGNEALKGGIYLIILPGNTYFEMIVADDQFFTVETSMDNIFHGLKFKDSDENQHFYNYQLFMSENGKKAEDIRKKISETLDLAEKEALTKELTQIDENIRAYMEKTVANNKGKFLGNLINTLINPKIPEFKVPENAKNPDSIKWAKSYRFNKKHYWDNITLSDERLLRTPVFKNKFDTYFKRILLQIPDTLKPEVDAFLSKAFRENKEVYQFALSELLSIFADSKIMGMDAMTVHIAEKYYLSGKADWATKELLSSLEEYVIKTKPNLIGNVAPSIKAETIDGKHINMYQINSTFTVLAFWEPDCGHCKKVIPKLYELKEKYADTQLQVVAMYTQIDKEEWEKFVNEKHLVDWYNVWDPHNFTNFRLNYGINSTPTLYLLDKDKKIIAKRVDVETIQKFIDFELKKKN